MSIPSDVSSSQPADSDRNKDARAFHLKEWEFLRADIRAQIEQSKYLEFATVGGLGAFYAWFVSTASPVPRFVLWLPMLLVGLGALRSYGTLKHIQRSAKYIRSLEEALSFNEGTLIGWDRTRDKLATKSAELKASAIFFWLTAAAISVLAWGNLPRETPNPSLERTSTGKELGARAA